MLPDLFVNVCELVGVTESVIQYPAIVVGLPVNEAKVCAGTDVKKPLSLVKSLTFVGNVGLPDSDEYAPSNASVIPNPAIVVGLFVTADHARVPEFAIQS